MPCMQTSWSKRNRGVGRVYAVWSAKTRRSPSSRRGLCHAPPIGCKLSTNRKRKPKWRRCGAASIAVGPSAIPTGSQTRPSDWGWNGRFGLVEDRRNNHKACHIYLYYPDLVAVTFHRKCENLQRVGAFKFRGAMNALLLLDEGQKAAGVVTHSSGNHAQALALAGQLLGVPVTIVMPRTAPAVKRAATEGYGARIVLC